MMGSMTKILKTKKKQGFVVQGPRTKGREPRQSKNLGFKEQCKTIGCYNSKNIFVKLSCKNI